MFSLKKPLKSRLEAIKTDVAYERLLDISCKRIIIDKSIPFLIIRRLDCEKIGYLGARLAFDMQAGCL
jgi:hypothetical protein